MKELEYRKYILEKAKQVKTKEQLDNLLEEIINGKEPLDYGKIVYAMSAAMIAASEYINNSNVGGITGFQACFVGWEMVREFLVVGENKTAVRLVNFDHMLYPQYKDDFQKTISKDTWKSLQKEAKKLLKSREHAHPKVVKHWQSIVNGKVPFGYKVVK